MCRVFVRMPIFTRLTKHCNRGGDGWTVGAVHVRLCLFANSLPDMLLHNRPIALLIGLIISMSCAGAADIDNGAYWRSGLLQTGWSKKDGAPSSVFSMTQDSAGMIWFAASDGLYHITDCP